MTPMLDTPHPTPVTPFGAPCLDQQKLATALSGLHFIGGRYVPALSGQSFAVVNPATGIEVARAAEGDAQDVDAAVRDAARAQKEWAKVPARKRGALVYQCAALLKEHQEELARLIALETGKALRTESRVEAGVVADVFEFFGGLGSELKGESVPFAPNVLSVTVREPLGVVGAIIPWNVPMLLMALKVAPALVAGNTVVVKSAEEAPLAVLRICELMNRILPPGCFNMVSGMGPECGAPLVEHPLVRKVTFTGSVETGKIVAKAASQKLVPVTLELGGKSPMIVFADCDFAKTVSGALTSMRFTRQGQSCTAASRIYVERPIFAAFVAEMEKAVNGMVMGDPLDEKTDIGTIISQGQFEKVQGFIAEGKATPGATALECSAMPSDPALKKGLFLRPVIFTGLDGSSRLVREEIFGPVTVIQAFDDPEAVLAEANDSEYGLAASLWTNNLKVGLDLAHRLEAGLVQINQNLVVQANLSYGGVKSSGLGQEASLVATLKAAGMTVIQPDIAAWSKPVLASVPAKFEERWGKGSFDTLKAL
jgi:acyl-CoA reductase-like NAD-dependent aldehyde dehydrogenase